MRLYGNFGIPPASDSVLDFIRKLSRALLSYMMGIFLLFHSEMFNCNCSEAEL